MTAIEVPEHVGMDEAKLGQDGVLVGIEAASLTPASTLADSLAELRILIGSAHA